MTGSCWRLLAFFSLIFMVSAVLHGQDTAVDRWQDGRVLVPIPAPRTFPRGPAPGLAIDWTTPWPRHFPLAPKNSGAQPSIFPQLVRSAGIIFSGRVILVGKTASPPGRGSTSITFQVEHAMRGAAPGQNLTIHEWSGLWDRGERYRVGEHVLLFLYSPSKLGLTSPVAGAMGRFALNPEDKVVMNPMHIMNLVTDPLLRGGTTVRLPEFELAVRRILAEGGIAP